MSQNQTRFSVLLTSSTMSVLASYNGVNVDRALSVYRQAFREFLTTKNSELTCSINGTPEDTHFENLLVDVYGGR